MGFAKPDIAAAPPGAPHSVGRSYARRQPEHSLVHQLVAAEADGVRAAVYRASEHGRGLLSLIQFGGARPSKGHFSNSRRSAAWLRPGDNSRNVPV